MIQKNLGIRMGKQKAVELTLASTLAQVRHELIELECLMCDRHGTFERAALVKKHGARVTFARLRRMAALGCERLVDPKGDRCGTRFLCLPPRRNGE